MQNVKVTGQTDPQRLAAGRSGWLRAYRFTDVLDMHVSRLMSQLAFDFLKSARKHCRSVNVNKSWTYEYGCDILEHSFYWKKVEMSINQNVLLVSLIATNCSKNS